MGSALIIATLDDVDALVGVDLGVSKARSVGQDRIAEFADATEDHTPIHLETEQALAAGLPSTIAHGLLTLSLGPALLCELLTIGEGLVGLNYGFDRVRFIKPVPVGARLRMGAKVEAVLSSGSGRRALIAESFALGDGTPVCFAMAILHLARREGERSLPGSDQPITLKNRGS
jgi:acyl dehydratase